MALNLSMAKHSLIEHMVVSNLLKVSEMADVAGCTKSTIQRHCTNRQCFGSASAPTDRGGRRATITPAMLDALREHLLEKPDQDFDDLVIFLWDEFETRVSRWTIRRALSSRNWSAKTMRRIGNGRNADLRDYYEHTVSEILSYQHIYVDESGCDKRVGFRRRGWSPRGVTPTTVAPLHRGHRYQILPAYTQDGIILSRVFQGNTDADVFLDFIHELLHCHCNPFQGKHSVIIMDNASFHHSEEVKLARERAGVLLIFLPPYSPDKYSIEEWFGRLKTFIEKHFKVYENDPSPNSRSLLEWAIDEMGRRTSNAHGHFTHEGVTVDEHKQGNNIF